jgi:hypothetical protein
VAYGIWVVCFVGGSVGRPLVLLVGYRSSQRRSRPEYSLRSSQRAIDLSSVHTNVKVDHQRAV